MARINKHELTPEQLEKLFNQFSNLLCNSSNRNVHLLLERLLGPEERIMLAKRLAIVVLLEKGYSYNNVADILHISTSTASNVDHRLKSGGIKRVVKILKQTEDGYVGIMDLLESILNVGGIMPSRTGLGRYRGIPR